EPTAGSCNCSDDHNSEAKCHRWAPRRGGVARGLALVNIERTPPRLDRARKFGERGITRGIENPAARFRDEIVDDRAISRKTPQGLLFVLGDEPRIAGNIGRKNRRDLPLHEGPRRETISDSRMPPGTARRNSV